MQRILLLLLMHFSLPAMLQAQVTQISSNTSLDLLAPLGTTKALLLESSFNRLWVTDATTSGTIRLSDTITYNGAGGLLNDQFVFAGTSPTYGSELWITDGTAAGTRLVRDIYPGTTSSEPQDDFAMLNGYLYFSASTQNEGRELWKTDGTAAGTTIVKDIIPGTGGSALKGRYDIASTGTYLLFNTTTAAAGYELWRSDGTEAGTYLLKDINPGVPSSTPSSYQIYNSLVLFWSETAAEGRELWRTDGTAAGTTLVKDIRTGPASSINTGFPMPSFSILYSFNNRLLFMADDGVHGEEIWTTDGTENGTYLLKDINPGIDRSFVSLLSSVPMNGKLYFAAYQQGSGSELWETDGTTNGTKLFKEILPGLDGGIPFLMPNFKFTNTAGWPVHQGPIFYFLFGLPADGGVELWKSNGTDAGTVKVKVMKTTDSDFGNLSYVYTNAGLYFSVDDGVHSDELWKSDGTDAGTTFIIDLNPNTGEGSEISFFPFPVNNKYMFTATNGDNASMWDLYHLDGDLVPLPVKLQNFTVSLSGADAQLRWLTATEENTQEFIVERSDDGSRFTQIGTITAAGYATKQSYSFKDAGVATINRQVVYYRLRIKDRDGKETMSKVLPLSLKKNGFDVKLLGNPVQQEIRLLLSQTTTPVTISLRDANGRIIRTWQVKPNGSLITLPIENVATGAYYLQLENAGKNSVIPVVKQ
jgi:ELWxxDGT repeat protein